MRVDIAESIGEFSAQDWNRLAGKRYPFLRHEFLNAAESSGCAGPESGWQARAAPGSVEAHPEISILESI